VFDTSCLRTDPNVCSHVAVPQPTRGWVKQDVRINESEFLKFFRFLFRTCELLNFHVRS